MDLEEKRPSAFGQDMAAVKVPWWDQDVGHYALDGLTYWGMTGNCPRCRKDYDGWDAIKSHFPCETN